MILKLFQKKLENELASIEEKHEAKKRKFVEASENFHGQLKKVCDFENVCRDIKQKRVRMPEYR